MNFSIQPSASRTSRRTTAFTLTELMVTMAVFTLLIAGVFSAQLMGMRMRRVSETKLSATANAFDRQLHRISVARAQAEKLTRTMSAVPIRKPVIGEIDTTSGFGVRLDPFLGRPAMHTGLDFRGNTGDPIRATASGTVTSAGWNGGYGRMVEVDHGHGMVTRYGHLSEIDVTVGQHIKIGQVVGRLGSTGRSTGPHLHYETRVDGDAVDPHKFLRAGIRMGNI